MKSIINILLFLISSSLFTQNVWEPIILPDSLLARYVYAEKEGIIYVGATSTSDISGLYKSINEGLTWEHVIIDSLIPNNFVNSICHNQDNILFVSTAYGMYRAIGNGETFELVSSDNWRILELKVSPNNHIYALGWIGILRSIDDGITWDTLYDASYSQYFKDIDFGPNGNIYAVGGDFGVDRTGCIKSTDNGNNWEECGPENINAYGHLKSIEINNVGTIIVGGFSVYNVYHSYDNAETWIMGPEIRADAMESSGNILIAGRNVNNNNGCWSSEDWGHNWIDLVDDVLNPNVNHISISPSNTVYIQSYENSFYDYNLFRSINPIVDLNKNEKSFKFKIFPNPTTGKILIDINNDENIVDFNLYNLSGQKILTGDILNNEINITHLNSGIYILESQINNFITRKKIVKK